MVSAEQLEHRRTLGFRDLDCLTTAKEVQEALTRKLGDAAVEVKVILTKAKICSQKLTIVELEQNAASKLLETGGLRIGMMVYRPRKRIVVTRCYKCLMFGHLSRNCKGPDRIECCYKYREKSPRCVACADRGASVDQLGHVLGSGACQSFRDALAEAKRRRVQKV